MILDKKVAVITGSGSGIGKATALHFAKEGAKVVVVDIVRETGEETNKLILNDGGDSIFVHANVTIPKDMERIISTVMSNYGRIDVLFNNAGAWNKGNVVDTEESAWDDTMAVNLKSVFVSSKYCVKQMMKQESGVIINMGSVDGFEGVANSSAYCAAKAGVINLTRCMALDFAPKIRVNCIVPGTILTKVGRTVPSSQIPPMGRPGRPEEIARVAAFLASDNASYMTGSIVLVDGGLVIGRVIEFY